MLFADEPEKEGASCNVQKLASGGLALSPMLAWIGDAMGGGSAREAVLPLESDSAMVQVGGAIADNLPKEAIHRIVIASLTGRSPEDVPASLLPPATGASVPNASQPTYRAAVPIQSGQAGAAPVEVHNHHYDQSVKVEFGSFATLDPKRDAKIVAKEISAQVKRGQTRLTANRLKSGTR